MMHVPPTALHASAFVVVLVSFELHDAKTAAANGTMRTRAANVYREQFMPLQGA
jgi:hypothetical protein